jgi:site-specific recombinase XerD
VDRFLWFLEYRKAKNCGKQELRQFFAYLSNGHHDGGRWGNKRFNKPLRPATVRTYFEHLRAFFSWLENEEYLSRSPFHNFAPPVYRADQVQPFNPNQVEDILNACRKSKYPQRDEAIVRFLLDTGVRASEMCNLRMRDCDLSEGQARVLGKGNKYRTVCFGRKTSRALRAYFRYDERMPEEPLFFSERGIDAGAGLTRRGLLQLIERLGKQAKVQGTRCTPHVFRHTFAVEFLRNGGNVFSLKQMLGHTSLHMTNNYVALAEADIKKQHRQFSPGDRTRA